MVARQRKARKRGRNCPKYQRSREQVFDRALLLILHYDNDSRRCWYDGGETGYCPGIASVSTQCWEDFKYNPRCLPCLEDATDEEGVQEDLEYAKCKDCERYFSTDGHSNCWTVYSPDNNVAACSDCTSKPSGVKYSYCKYGFARCGRATIESEGCCCYYMCIAHCIGMDWKTLRSACEKHGCDLFELAAHRIGVSPYVLRDECFDDCKKSKAERLADMKARATEAAKAGEKPIGEYAKYAPRV